MSLYQAELKYFLRSPIVWLILSITAFFSAWSFFYSIELFTTLQVKFAGMSDAPSIIQGIVFPVIFAQSKLLIFIVSIIAGLSFSRLSQNNTWSLLSSIQMPESRIVRDKFLAVLTVVSLFLLPSLLAIAVLILLSGLPVLPILLAIMGVLLLMLWMISFALLISSFVNNTGFSILLCLVALMSLSMLAQSGIDAEWGKNWIQVFSPFYHFKQFSSNYLSFAALFYLIVGSLINLWAVKVRLIHKRYVL